MVEINGRYGHPGGLIHAGLHGLLSLPALMVTAPMAPGLLQPMAIRPAMLRNCRGTGGVGWP